MIKKHGLFKKILTSDSGTAATTTDTTAEEAAEENPDENPFTPVSRPTQLPPPRPPEPRSKSHDPFEDDVDFGFTPGDDDDISASLAPEPPLDSPESDSPGDPEPIETPAPSPTFAMPEEKQMSPPATTPPPPSTPTDSETIRQLELRAIFGVDHEMSEMEILERSAKLNGVRRVTRLADGDTGTIDALKAMIARIGFGTEPVKIHAGSVPVDFIREGNVALAVQVEGGYAPGIRETLIIVARELAKM